MATLRESVVDKREPGGYVTPVEAAGEFATFVSRIREDKTVKNGLAMWIVADNLLKGAAARGFQWPMTNCRFWSGEWEDFTLGSA